MPTTRRSSGRSSAGAGKQSTLSFNHRVTKPVPKSAKDSVVSSASKPSPLSKSVKPEDEVETVEPEKQEEKEQVESNAVVPEKSEAELKASKITDAQINKYWTGLEAQRNARRVHQEDLSTGEKVLRYFDVSSQYGPCIGMPRLKRWMRAENLGLNPPIEVLAVLLKEEQKGNKSIERAHMDEIMNSTVVGAV